MSLTRLPSSGPTPPGRLVPTVEVRRRSCCIAAGAELSHPLRSLDSRSSFPHPPETEALLEQCHATSPSHLGTAPAWGWGRRRFRALLHSPPPPSPQRWGPGSPKLFPFSLSSVVSSRVTGKQIQPPLIAPLNPGSGSPRLKNWLLCVPGVEVLELPAPSEHGHRSVSLSPAIPRLFCPPAG